MGDELGFGPESQASRCEVACASAGDKLKAIFEENHNLGPTDIRFLYDITERTPFDDQLTYDIAFGLVFGNAMGTNENSRRIIADRMGNLNFPETVEQAERLDKFLGKSPKQMLNEALGVVRSEFQDHSRDRKLRPALEEKLARLEEIKSKIETSPQTA